MAQLLYYQQEREQFPEEHSRHLKDAEAEIIFKKLCRHFKLGNAKLIFDNRGNHGGYNWGKGWHIQINHSPNLLDFLHEMAHIFHCRYRRKQGEHYHNKKFNRVVKRFVNYCRKKNYWQEEIIKRTAPKPPKPEPTKEEIRMRKTKKVREKFKRYESKIKLYTTKLNKAKRSLAALERNDIQLRLRPLAILE